MKTHFPEALVFILMTITTDLALKSLTLTRFMLRNHKLLILKKIHQNRLPFSKESLPQFHLTLKSRFMLPRHLTL